MRILAGLVVLVALTATATAAETGETAIAKIKALICDTSPADPPRSSECGAARVLIATVPDPEKAGIPGLTDSAIESIHRAAARGGFTFHRGLLQWPKPDPVAPEGIGVLLFRSDPPGEVLAVLVVGETPARGVSAAPFALALLAAERLRVDKTQPVGVLGPTFSGSVPSIAQAVNRRPELKVRIVSGTATRRQNLADLGCRAGVEYFSLAENDQVSLDLFLRYLEDRGIPTSRVAMLAEAGTLYGSSLSNYKRGGIAPGFVAEFPMRISRLRAAYLDDPGLRSLWKSAPAASPGSQMNAGFQVAGSDGPPAFSKDQTPMSLDLAIAGTAETLRRRGIELAIVGASDVGDTLFLCKLLQRLHPDLRLATLDADLIYLHSTAELSYSGLMMVSPYPLWHPNQLWELDSAGQNRLQPFSNRSAQGIYNAARILLENDPAKQGLVEFQHPVDASRAWPPVWIAMVGRGSVWPMSMLTQPDDGSSSLQGVAYHRRAAGKAYPVSLEPSAAFSTLFLALSMLAVWAMANYVHFIATQRTYVTLFQLPERRSMARTLLISMLTACGVVVYLPFTAVIGVNGGYWSGSWHAILLAISVSLPLLCIPLGLATKETGFRVATFALAPLGWIFWTRWSAMADASRGGGELLFAVRTLAPFSGVDPLTPHVLVWFGLAWWAALQLHRMRMREIRYPACPRFHETQPLLRIAGGEFARVAAVLDQSRPGWREAVAIPLAAVFLLALLEFRTRLGLEPSFWQSCFLAGFATLWVLAVCAVLTVIRVWFTLEDALRPLRAHPLSAAFSRLPKEISVKKMWGRGSSRYPLQSALFGVDLLRGMVLDERQTQYRATAETALDECRGAGPKGLRIQADDAARLQEALRGAADSFVKEIGAGWGDPKHAAKEEYVALRLVAFVRYCVLHMRLMLEFLSPAVVLMFLAILLYPLQPNGTLVTAVTLLALSGGAAVIIVFRRMDTNEVLSRLNSDGKGAWDRGFYMRALTYGALPGLAAVASQFPGTFRTALEWTERLGKLLSG